MTRILDIALNTMWAMEEEALTNLLSIAGREHTVDNEALAAYRAEALKRAERTAFRDGVAVMNIDGALFPKANLMTDMSGATSYDILRRDLQVALDESKVKAILLNIDSPGGAVNGCSELAEAIYQARGRKPIVAYVRGTMASAAAFVGSAADRIVVNDMAEVGSIGCMMTLRKVEDPKGQTTFQFISSQSPLKNPDPESEAGAKSYQDRVDAMAQVFVETIARNRGVDTETALKNFGKGGIFIGKDAVKAGLADAVGNFESVLAELSAGRKGSPSGSRSTRSKGNSMSEQTEAVVDKPAITAEDVAAAVAEANKAERTRIGGLNRIAAAHSIESAVLAKAIEDGTSVADFALSVADTVAAKAKEGKDKALEALKNDETEAKDVKPSDGDKAAEKTADDLVKEMVASAKLAMGDE